MTDAPMTKKEIAAAREWIGLGDDELSDVEIVDVVKDSLWLARYRLRAAWTNLAAAIMTAVQAHLAELRAKMTKPKD